MCKTVWSKNKHFRYWEWNIFIRKYKIVTRERYGTLVTLDRRSYLGCRFYSGQCPSSLTSRLYHSCDKGRKIKLKTDEATLVARNSYKVMVTPMMVSGGVCVCRTSGIRRSVLWLCFWQEFGFSSYEDVYTLNLISEEILINSVLLMRFTKIMLR